MFATSSNEFGLGFLCVNKYTNFAIEADLSLVFKFIKETYAGVQRYTSLTFILEQILCFRLYRDGTPNALYTTFANFSNLIFI